MMQAGQGIFPPCKAKIRSQSLVDYKDFQRRRAGKDLA
jgi:hypothetical protein